MITMNRCKMAFVLSAMFVLAACGQQTTTKDLSLTVDAGVIAVATTSLPGTKVPDGATCGVALIAGLTLDSTTGVISGTPTATGSGNITIAVTDSSTIPIADPPYNVALEATGGVPAYQWTVSAGALPSGITLDAATGVISGTPPSPGLFAFDVIVTDSVGATASASLTINVFGIATNSLPSGIVGLSYSATLTAKGGTLPYTWSLKVCP